MCAWPSTAGRTYGRPYVYRIRMYNLTVDKFNELIFEANCWNQLQSAKLKVTNTCAQFGKLLPDRADSKHWPVVVPLMRT